MITVIFKDFKFFRLLNALNRFICILFLSFFLLFFLGCSSKSSRETIQEARDRARTRPAAIEMEAFWTDYRSPPDREYQHWEFYYKNCALISRKPYPDRAEYECMDPY